MTTLSDLVRDQPGIATVLSDFRNQLELLTGNTLSISDDALVKVYQQQTPGTLAQFANTLNAVGGIPADYKQAQPWILYGLSFDQYQQQATTFATEYKKITGQDIPPSELQRAFTGMRGTSGAEYGTGALLTGSEYAQQLQNDSNIQKTFGWVKYGYDYQQFQQQKLQMRQSFGQDLTDQQATVQLQYLHAAGGANMSAVARPSSSGQQQARTPDMSGSVVR